MNRKDYMNIQIFAVAKFVDKGENQEVQTDMVFHVNNFNSIHGFVGSSR